MHSSSSCQETLGEWAPEDALWNYLDVPHLNFVHSAVSGEEFYSSDEVCVSVFEQQVFGLRLRAVTAIVKRCDDLIEYVTSLPFVRISVSTKISRLDEQCRVRTTYTVSTSSMLRPLHRLIHWTLARNYRLLMSEDLPMREQRARLRERGVGFARDRDGYGFEASKRVGESNVLPAHHKAETVPIARFPQAVGEWSRLTLSSGLELLVSRGSGHDEVLVLPGICPHEGAHLAEPVDCAVGQDAEIKCPWHGRCFRPRSLTAETSATIGRLTVAKNGDFLRISTVSDVERARTPR